MFYKAKGKNKSHLFDKQVRALYKHIDRHGNWTTSQGKLGVAKTHQTIGLSLTKPLLEITLGSNWRLLRSNLRLFAFSQFYSICDVQGSRIKISYLSVDSLVHNLIPQLRHTKFNSYQKEHYFHSSGFQKGWIYCKHFTHLLTHWGRVTHICVGNLTTIGLDNGLSPGWRQAIIWPNAWILLIGAWGTNFSETLIKILVFSFKKMRLKLSSAKRQPFCPGLNVLMT